MNLSPFPILLPEEEIRTGIWQPAELFVEFVNILLRGGVLPELLPTAFLDLYALDYYHCQVSNGGHSQFIGNSGGRWPLNLDRALQGARMLCLPELAQLLAESRDWCEENPIERDAQDGASHRAVALNSLDDRFHDLDFEEITYASFVAAQTESVQAWIRSATSATDFRSRSMYYLAVGAWLLRQPNTELVPSALLDASLDRLLIAYTPSS